MIFTQADRDKIFPALDRIEREVSKTASSQWAVAFAKQFDAQLVVLNELGAALGRIEAAEKKEWTTLGVRWTALCDAIQKIENAQKYSYDRLQTELEKSITEVQNAVNRRADEALDVVRGLRARVDNLTAAPLTPLGEALAALPDLLKAIGERQDQHAAALKNMIDAQRMCGTRVTELTGLVQAEVSEASTFRKELRGKVDWEKLVEDQLACIRAAVVKMRRDQQTQDKFAVRLTKLVNEANAEYERKRKARRKKK